MPSEISTNKILITSKPTESRWLAIWNLPEKATKETIKEYFERYGPVQSIKIDDQHCAFVAFLDIHIASKAHHAENILDQQQLRTAFSDGSNSISKILLETSPITSSIIEPSSSSPSSITTVTNTLMDKTITEIHEDRDKRATYSPQENTRHQVVPIKHDSEYQHKTSQMKSIHRKYDHSSSSSSSSERSYKYRHQHPSKLKRQISKRQILKIDDLPSKMSTQSLREILRKIFIDFKKSSHLLTIKIIDNYALLTFRKYEDVEKALVFIKTKSINGIRLKAQPYNDLIIENNDYDLMKRSISSDLDLDEYSIKATRTLYIGNLQSEISYQELREIYSVYGEILEIEIKRQQSQYSFAFIQYTDIKSVVKAFKSHVHSIKLGFGKSQPTNVLWLDDLPLNLTEIMLRTFLNHLTNLSSNDILDIYIDNQKNEIVQCLIYFNDIITAQNVIHLIRGKIFQTKRIQIDFASRIFLTKFSNIIQQTNTNRRYSKISDTSHHHHSSSSDHSLLIKSDTDKHANTSRIFDWLMQNHHSNLNTDKEEEQISNIKLIKTKNNFQTKIIPLQSNSLFIQSDIRRKVYSSLYKQTINSRHFLLPEFAKNLIKNQQLNQNIQNLSASTKYNPMSSTTTLHPTVPSSSNKDLSNIFSIKFKRKPIPPPLSVIPTLPIPSNTNDSPIFPTPKSITPSSAFGNQNHSPKLLFSPISQKQITNNSPKPTVLKSILKQPSSNPSQSTSNETRKVVHIISSNPSIKRTLPSNNTKKPLNPQKNNMNKHKLIETAKPLHPLNKIPKTSSLKLFQQNQNLLSNKPSISPIKKPEQKLKKKFLLKQTTCMYDRIKERSRNEMNQSSKPIIFDSEIFDTEENDQKKINEPQKFISKFNKKKFILKKKSLMKKRPLGDEGNRSSKKIKLHTKIKDEEIIKSENDMLIENVVSSVKISKNDDQQLIPVKIKNETMQLDDSIDFNRISSPTINQIQEDNSNKQETLNELFSQIVTDTSVTDDPTEKILHTANHTNLSSTPIDHQVFVADKLISTTSSKITKSSCTPLSTTNESLNQFDSRSITTPKHPSTQILTPDNNLLTPHHQYFSYPFFAPPPPDSPASSTRTLSTSSCSSIIGNPFYNSIIPGQQHCHEKELRRDSLSKFSTTSSQYLGSSIDPISPFRNPSELYNYPPTAQHLLNTYATEFYRMDPYDIQWEGYIILKTDQAYIKTQLIAGNSQIARIAINYWNSDLNDNLRISQRMRLEEIQLDGVKKHMQMTNNHCILIAEPNGLTPDQIRFEQNHLKNGVIQYLNEKKAAGILNILLPGVLQPVYVVHIFPPCQFASEILQKRAPDAYRCVVQNKIEQIYLLFIITSTV